MENMQSKNRLKRAARKAAKDAKKKAFRKSAQGGPSNLNTAASGGTEKQPEAVRREKDLGIKTDLFRRTCFLGFGFGLV